jgi:1,4-dihydroxy-2-naphthoyl-CoA synthase
MGNILSNKLGQVLHLTLDRPEKKNALTPAMYSDLSRALIGAKDDFDIRVVVISGAGSAFTGGHFGFHGYPTHRARFTSHAISCSSTRLPKTIDCCSSR